MAVCKNGHQSDDPDYCSICGVAMGGSASTIASASQVALATPAPSGSPAGVCPECGTSRPDPDARYCEVCRHDFAGGATAASTGPATPPVEPTKAIEPFSAPGAPSPAPAASPARYQIVVAQDPSLDVDPDPTLPCPQDPERTFPFDLPEMLVGRRDDRRGIYPQVPVSDPGVSHRHANLLRLPDGSVAMRDLASTNGTYVNGNEIPPGVPFLLQPGDAVTLGRWTRLRIQES